MTLSNRLHQLRHRLASLPRKYWVIGGAALLVAVYSLIFFIPKTVQFSYAGESCARQLVLFPGFQQLSSDEFELAIKDELKIGSFAYAATTVCAEPKQSPDSGSYAASIKPFGLPIMAKQLSIAVGDAPVARQADLVGKSISTALPLKIQLSTKDSLHHYELSVAQKRAACEMGDTQLICDVEALDLTPGSDYSATLTRSYKGDSATVVSGDVKTLLPVKLGEASVSDGQTIYESPKTFTFQFDLPLQEADVSLQQKEADARKSVSVSARTAGNTLTVTLSEELARKTDYSLVLNQVIAENGSALDQPIAINFATSGGPKPSNVSVGGTNVPQNASIVVTFDQPIKEGVDISKYIALSGIGGSVTQRSATEVVVAIRGGLCQAFSVSLKEGMESGTNAAVSEAWKFDARTVCGTSSVIGYSVNGRPIIAYYFGNGSETILFTGGIHGEERSAQQTMQAWADYLMTNAYKIPADKRVVVVPNLNPDGIARGVRNNANNVNLGRNYPSNNWVASIDTASGNLPTGGGTSAGSEPETKAIMALTSQLRLRLEISFHAQGRLVGANKVGDSTTIGNIYASTVGYSTMYHNAEEIMGYSITGEYEEWMGEKLGIPAILIELPSRQGSYLTSQLPALMKMLNV